MKTNLFCSLLLTTITALCACDPNSEAVFTSGRSLLPCVQTVPACPALPASCTLNETTYAQRRFPDESPFRFLVPAFPNERIEVTLYFVTQSDAGLDTRIYWYEPGCSDVYDYSSEGADLFAEAEATNTIVRTQTVYEGGDHLVEIISDMQAVVDIAVEVLVPERR